MNHRRNNIFMGKIKLLFLLILTFSLKLSSAEPPAVPIRILVITGGHDYPKEQFNQMLGSLGENITYQVAELPVAYDMFLPQNRDKYDVLVFYHMWQEITDEQAKAFSECIRNGKPLVVLHHSICAYDNWPEYFNIIGGKYFHKPTVVNGREYPACSYIHDVHFRVRIADRNHPVTTGLDDFDIFDETYKGYYVEPGVTPLLATDEPSSNQVIGWAKKYGKARVVTLQSGHDIPTFENPNFRKLLRQSIEWVYNSGENR
jgi:type 1 glutamine amidotransferase